MASLEHVRYVPHHCQIIDGQVIYTPQRNGRVIDKLPQIFWSDHTPWREANLWAVERATSREISLETVEANLRGLVDYATFLESKNLQWFTFPTRKAERCLVQYRGALIEARDNGELRPSTSTQRMRHVIQFYRWVQERGLLSPSFPMWRDKVVLIKYFDATGFERTLARQTTDLAIPNRSRPGERLEDGLLPVSATDRDAILEFAHEHSSPELFLMLSLGFFTGMRLGTICDLKVQTLEHAVPDPSATGLYRLAVGPGASPPVQTKFGVTGQVWIPGPLLEELREYFYSPRRLLREAKGSPENRNLLFLTRFGNPYGRRGADRSTAVNVEMSGFRKAGVAEGLAVLRGFHFHQSRCTFATELARLAMMAGDAVNAIAIVMEALLHKDEATSFRYIKFVQKMPLKQAAANEFTALFLGVKHGSRAENSSDV